MARAGTGASGFFYTPSSGQLVPAPSPAFGEAYVAGLNASGQAILDDQTTKKAKAYLVSGSGFSKIEPPDHLMPTRVELDPSKRPGALPLDPAGGVTRERASHDASRPRLIGCFY